MAIILFTFLLPMTIVLAAYWLLVVERERRVRRRLHARLTGSAPQQTDATPELTLLRPADRLAWAHRAPPRLRPLYIVAARLAWLIEQSGWQLRLRSVAAAGCAAAIIGTLLVRTGGGGAVPMLLAAGVGGASPILALLHARRARLRRLEELLPEAVDLIARALRAGHTLPGALQTVGEEVPDPIGAEFRLLHEHFRFGAPLPDLLRYFADRVPLVDARFLATAILVQRETGGNLSEVLDNLAVVIRDRLKVRRQVRTVTAHGRLTGWILSALPPVLALVMFVVRPDYILTLVREPLGTYLVGTAIMLETVGVVVIRRIVRVEY